MLALKFIAAFVLGGLASMVFAYWLGCRESDRREREFGDLDDPLPPPDERDLYPEMFNRPPKTNP